MNEKLHDVFVSYSTKDTVTAFAVVDAFEQQGISCWIAPRNIPNGTLWADAIDNAIEHSRIFLVIVSENSINSKQVPKEIALAISSCDHIIPLRIDQTDLVGSFRYYLSDYQWVDGQPESTTMIANLTQDVLRMLDREPVSVSETVTSVSDTSSVATLPAHSPAMTLGPKKHIPIIACGVIAALLVTIVVIAIGGKSSESSDETLSTESVVETVPDSTSNDASVLTVQPNPEPEPELSETATETEPTVATEEPQPPESEAPAASVSEPEETPAPSAEPANPCSPQLFGAWELVDYVEKGVSLELDLSDFIVMEDGTMITSAFEDGISPQLSTEGRSINYAECCSAVTSVPYAAMEVAERYSLNDSYTPEGAFAALPSVRPMVTIQFGADAGPYTLPGYYEDYYPEQYLIIEITGTYQESPVSTADVGTKIVYKRTYPLLDTAEKRLALTGQWKDSQNNIWSFSTAENGGLTFNLSDTSGTVHQGIEISSVPSDPDAADFGEKITFVFNDFTSPEYYIKSFSASKLELIDPDGTPTTLTRQ